MTGMRAEPALPKYATIADTLQTRMHNGVYPPGSMLPSEAQLVREFGASRSTVVRALEYLRQLGYIEGVQGKGRLALGPPPPSPHGRLPDRIFDALHTAEIRIGSTLLGAGCAPASPRIAAALAIPAGEPVIARQRTMPTGDAAGLTLSTIFLPAVAARGTNFADAPALREGALVHLERRRDLIAGDVVERLTARVVSAREAALLGVDRHAVALTSLLVVRSQAGKPLLVIDLVMPVTPSGIEELFVLH